MLMSIEYFISPDLTDLLGNLLKRALIITLYVTVILIHAQGLISNKMQAE